jgi:adenylate cyclase
VALEIERKFLVVGYGWRGKARTTLTITDHLIARFEMGKARIRMCNNAATLTFKGQRNGISRSEYHIDLSLDEAQAMVAEFAVTPPLEKRRHEVEAHGLVWQVDEFGGPLSGLVTADVELPSEQHELLVPEWVGREITLDRTYSSGTLAARLAEELSGANPVG